MKNKKSNKSAASAASQEDRAETTATVDNGAAAVESVQPETVAPTLTDDPEALKALERSIEIAYDAIETKLAPSRLVRWLSSKGIRYHELVALRDFLELKLDDATIKNNMWVEVNGEGEKWFAAFSAIIASLNLPEPAAKESEGRTRKSRPALDKLKVPSVTF